MIVAGQWCSARPDLAAILPTVSTARGAHVYSVSANEHRVKQADAGEVRGAGGYCLLPPSRHPDGQTVYSWKVPLPECLSDIRRVEPDEAGLVTEKAEADRSGLTLYSLSCSVLLCNKTANEKESEILTLEIAAMVAVPKRPHVNHKASFNLARSLMSLEKNWKRKVTDAERLILFKLWYSEAAPFLKKELSFDEYYFEFLDSCKNAKCPFGESTLSVSLERAKTSSTPACAMQFQTEEVRFLVTLFRELQREHNPEPFFMSCHKLGEILNHPNHVKAYRYLLGLERTGIIGVATKGTSTRATRYRYLMPLDQ